MTDVEAASGHGGGDLPRIVGQMTPSSPVLTVLTGLTRRCRRPWCVQVLIEGRPGMPAVACREECAESGWLQDGDRVKRLGDNNSCCCTLELETLHDGQTSKRTRLTHPHPSWPRKSRAGRHVLSASPFLKQSLLKPPPPKKHRQHSLAVDLFVLHSAVTSSVRTECTAPVRSSVSLCRPVPAPNIVSIHEPPCRQCQTLACIPTTITPRTR